MISAKKLMNVKVVELIKIYNFYFGHLFIRQSGSNFVKFLNNVTTTTLDKQMTKIKVVDLGKL